MCRWMAIALVFGPCWFAAVGCKTQQRAEPSPGGVGITAAPTSAAPGAETSPPPRANGERHGTFACGTEQCRVGEQSCCRAGDNALCIANAPPDPPTSSQLLGTQIDACSKSPLGGVGEIARCRSSSHCPAGELCCNEFMFSGASALICKPALASEVACAYGEMCTPELPCRSPNAVCVKGECRVKTDVSCGTTSCDMTAHTCVVADPSKGPLECKSDSELAARQGVGPVFSVACLKHADCLPGELCRTALGRTFCQRADDGMTATMCDAVADCPKDMCAWLKPAQKQPACVREPDIWHTICDCR